MAQATIRQRPGKAGTSYRVEWRYGGGREGRKQGVTLPTRKLATLAKDLVDSRRLLVTDEEAYRSVYGLDRNEDVMLAPTLSAWIREWAQRKVEIQPDTIAGYLQTLAAYVEPRLGGLRLDMIGAEQVKDWKAWMAQQTTRRGAPLAPATVRRAHAVLHQLLGAAVPRWLPANPAAALPGTGRSSNGLPRAVTYEATFLGPAEVELVVGCCPPQIRDLVVVAVRTGLRLGELLALRAQDVDLASNPPRLHVRRALKADDSIGEPKSRRSRRAVTLDRESVAVLRPRVADRRRTALVFPSPAGAVWDKNNLNRRYWHRAVGAAQRCPLHPPPPPPKPKRGPARGWRPDEVSTCGCPGRLHSTPRFHDLRHTHVALLLATGRWDIAMISRRLGHESISTTADIYGHLLPDGDDARLEALEGLLSRRPVARDARRVKGRHSMGGRGRVVRSRLPASPAA